MSGTSTITILDTATSAPVIGVLVQLWNADGLTLVTSGVTNGSGVYTFTSLVAGTYQADLTPPVSLAVHLVDKVVFTATGGDDAHTLHGDLFTVTPPNPPTCTVYGYVFGPDGTPVQTTVLVDTGKGAKSVVEGGGTTTTGQTLTASIISMKRELRSNAVTGRWSITVPVDAFVRVYIPELRYIKHFQVPSATSANIVDIVPLQGQSNTGMVSDVSNVSGYLGNG